MRSSIIKSNLPAVESNLPAVESHLPEIGAENVHERTYALVPFEGTPQTSFEELQKLSEVTSVDCTCWIDYYQSNTKLYSCDAYPDSECIEKFQGGDSLENYILSIKRGNFSIESTEGKDLLVDLLRHTQKTDPIIIQKYLHFNNLNDTNLIDSKVFICSIGNTLVYIYGALGDLRFPNAATTVYQYLLQHPMPFLEEKVTIFSPPLFNHPFLTDEFIQFFILGADSPLFHNPAFMTSLGIITAINPEAFDMSVFTFSGNDDILSLSNSDTPAPSCANTWWSFSSKALKKAFSAIVPTKWYTFFSFDRSSSTSAFSDGDSPKESTSSDGGNWWGFCKQKFSKAFATIFPKKCHTSASSGGGSSKKSDSYNSETWWNFCCKKFKNVFVASVPEKWYRYKK